MNNKVKFLPFCLFSISLLTGCNLEAYPKSTTALMTAINYGENTRITYQEDKEYSTPGWSKTMLDRMEDFDKHRRAEGRPELFKDAKESRPLSKGDYKPVWAALQNRLGVKLLEHQGAACSGEKKSVSYFRDNWLNNPYADITMGTVYAINNYSVSGDHETILDLKPYIERTTFSYNPETEKYDILDEGPKPNLPHIALFLKNNPAVKMSVTTAKHSHHERPAIYYIPYFDGFNDLERMPVVRADFIERLLDDDPDNQPEGKEFSDVTNILGANGKYKKSFEPCYIADEHVDTAPVYTIDYPNVDEDGQSLDPKILSFTKNETKNIIVRQNQYIDSDTASSKNLAREFRSYIDDRYGKPGEEGSLFKKYSDLFLDYKACYDADEMVALMRLIKVSSGTIFGKNSEGKWIEKEMVPMMPRELDNQRSSDLYRWAGQMFGNRGFDSRNGYLYLKDKTRYEYKDEYDKVHDCRGDQSTVDMLKKMNNLYKEGLILQEFDTNAATGNPNGKFSQDTMIGGGTDNFAGFMVYDFCQDIEKYNRDKKSEEWKAQGHAYNVRPIVNAVAHWYTGEDGIPADEWVQFSESWCSIKTSGLCLNAKLVDTPEKLEAAFKVVDYIYSDEGKYLYNYGPWEDGYMYPFDEMQIQGDIFKYVEYQGKKIPAFTETAISKNRDIDNHLRRYVGATIPFGYEKLKGMEVQNYTDEGKLGIKIINKCIECKTFKHVLTDYNPADVGATKAFYKIVPSAFFLTTGQSSAIATLLDKAKLGSMFTDSSQNNFNIWDSYVMGKKSSIAPSLDDYIDTINNKWELTKLVKYYQSGYEAMV